MTRRRARLGAIVSLAILALLLPGGGVLAQASAAADPVTLVACGDGPAFPLMALDGLQGAELAGDGPSSRLARAATTGEAGYVPRGGWMRVLAEPDRAVFATWLHLPRSMGGPLLQLTVTTDDPGSADPDAWSIASAGFCWPRVVPPEGSSPVAWGLAEPADPTATTLTVVPAGPACVQPAPVVVLTPERVSVTVVGPRADGGCEVSTGSLSVALPEPLGVRELLDGAADPPVPVQPAPDPAPAASPPIDPAAVTVSAVARPTALARTHAIADALGSVPKLVPVDVVDALDLDITLAAARDLVLAGPPRLCLVGPFAAPDDAGLIDRCWGDPDPGAALAAAVPHDTSGHPVLRAGEPVRLTATIDRGDIRCDYPPGAWHLEVVLTPLVDGHGWTDVVLPDVPLAIDATALVPATELDRLATRYCGMARFPDGIASPGP